MALERHVI
jgi:hypothetical protein